MNLCHVNLLLLKVLIWVFHVEYKAFSFDSIIPDLPFKLDDNILHIEYESFCGLDVDMSLNKDFCAEYESFSVDPIQADLLLEY